MKRNFLLLSMPESGDGPANILNAINLLHPTRLGHGVRSIENSNLVKEL